MKSKVFLAIFLVGISQGKPNGPRKELWQKAMCMGKELVLPEVMDETTESCHAKVFGSVDMKEMNQSKPEWKKKGMCMMVCHAQKLGIADDNLKIDNKRIQKLVEDMKVPKEAIEKLKPVAEKCIADFGAGLKVTEEDCTSVEKLVHCMRDAFVQTCMPELADMIKKQEEIA